MTRVPIPTSAEGLEEILNDQGRMSDLLKDKADFAEFIRNYAATVQDKNSEVSAQVREQTQQVLAEWLKENGQDAGKVKLGHADSGTPRLAGAHGSDVANYQARKNKLYNKSALAAPLDGTFTGSADFFRALALNGGSVNRMRNGADLRRRLDKLSEIQNSFGTNAPADGGFLLPEAFRSDLLMVSLEHSLIRSKATIIPMETQRVAIPAVDSTSNVSTVFGGIQTYWVDEGTAPPESSAKFQQVVLDAKKLMAYCTAPNELVADATAFGAFLDQALPKALAFEEDYRFMQGNGSGQPLGFVNCPAAILATAVSGQGANTIIVDNLAAMFSRMLPSSLMTAEWYATIDAFPQLALLAVQGSLGNSTPVWMNNGVIGAPPLTIYGRPVNFTEKLPGLGTTGDIVFADPSFYLVGDRQAIEASASPHFLYSSDKTAYKIIERVDGRPWMQSAITQKNNSANTLSPFVQLSSTRT